jgi:hypothetical protein
MEHLTNRDLNELRARRLSADRLATVSEHLLACRACRSLAEEAFHFENSVREFQAALEHQPLVDEQHPVEELPWFIDGRLDSPARLKIERHLSICGVCSEEVQDLRRWAIQIDRSDSRRTLKRLSLLAAAIAICVLLGWSAWRPLLVAPEAQRPAVAAGRQQLASPSPRSVALRREWQDLVSNALQTGRVPFPADLRELSRSDTYRGDPEPAAPGEAVHPSATAVDDPVPDFSWPAIEGDTYEVVVTDGGTEVAKSPRLSAPRWRPVAPLERGKTYQWQIVAQGAGGMRILPGRPAPPAVFRVLTAVQHREIRDARREHPENHLLAGLLYARAGVVDLAREQLALYAESDRSPVARRLLRDLDDPR